MSKSRTPEYRAWAAMKQRCTNPNSSSWENYGGRGIQVCQRWLDSFDAFLVDVGQRPSPLYSLDRIDNDGDYAPDNCRWTTPDVQAQNRRQHRGPDRRWIRRRLLAWRLWAGTFPDREQVAALTSFVVEGGQASLRRNEFMGTPGDARLRRVSNFGMLEWPLPQQLGDREALLEFHMREELAKARVAKRLASEYRRQLKSLRSD